MEFGMINSLIGGNIERNPLGLLGECPPFSHGLERPLERVDISWDIKSPATSGLMFGTVPLPDHLPSRFSGIPSANQTWLAGKSPLDRGFNGKPIENMWDLHGFTIFDYQRLFPLFFWANVHFL